LNFLTTPIKSKFDFRNMMLAVLNGLDPFYWGAWGMMTDNWRAAFYLFVALNAGHRAPPKFESLPPASMWPSAPPHDTYTPPAPVIMPAPRRAPEVGLHETMLASYAHSKGD
jgi:hypothetical protein